MKSLLGYYGGKAGPAGGWITAQLPPHQIYVEPFGGMCGVLMQKRPSPVEVYNDQEKALHNLLTVVRDQPEALRAALALTPYSRTDGELAHTLKECGRTIANCEEYNRPDQVRLNRWRLGLITGEVERRQLVASRGEVAA